MTNTGMAVVNDTVNDLQDIHPENKKLVGDGGPAGPSPDLTG